MIRMLVDVIQWEEIGVRIIWQKLNLIFMETVKMLKNLLIDLISSSGCLFADN